MHFEFSSGVIVYHQSGRTRRYLILHYESGHFDFPKGHIEKGETEEEAAIRETLEETGLAVEIHDGFKEKVSYYFKASKELVHKTVYFFVGGASRDEVTLSDEHIGYVWLPLDQALKQLSFANAREILQKADAFITQKR